MIYLLAILFIFFTSCETVHNNYCSQIKNGVISKNLIKKAKKVLKISSDAPESWIINNLVWLCNNGIVYVCFKGANIPCLVKADTSKKPNKEPVILKQIFSPDKQGYIS